jgi:hypothetical protein
MRTSRLAPLAVACLLILSACDSGGSATPSPTSSAPPVATPSPTPIVTPPAIPTPTPALTPSPPFGPHPPLGQLLITTRGLLPLTHTDPIAGNAGEQMLEWDEDHCYSEEMGITTDTGRWIANTAYYPPDPTFGAPFLVDTATDGAVHRIDITSPAISTPEGVHIGTPVADLLATYPFIITGTPGYATNIYWIVDAHGIVVFETGVGTPMGGPGPEQVWFIRILGSEWDPDWAVYGSGNIAGACF